jgi:D-erythro-7,8-dihydroneopterin triphosphate epimerase
MYYEPEILTRRRPAMSQPDAIIRIKNLRLRTFIGIKEEEIANRQDIVINVVIHYPADKARASEDQ